MPTLVGHKYAVANQRIEPHVVDVPVPLSPWRAVSSSQNGFFLGSFIGELAHAAGQDSLTFRRVHLVDQPRHSAVLDRLSELASWGDQRTGVFQGIAIFESYGSVVGQVVDIVKRGDAHAIVAVSVVIACGRALNPDQVIAQMEGSVIDALGAAARQQVTIERGRAQQSNFHDYPQLRIGETPPTIRVAIVEDAGALGGVGEPGVSPLAPAVANALFAASGKRVRSLPFGSALSL